MYNNKKIILKEKFRGLRSWLKYHTQKQSKLNQYKDKSKLSKRFGRHRNVKGILISLKTEDLATVNNYKYLNTGPTDMH